jgi:pimeloyl-ACP methyl ester carboxylesterase
MNNSDPAMPLVDGVSHRWVDAGGLRMHVAEAGPADGEAVLLLHGWPQHWYEWRHVVPLLSDRYRLVMPDLRGLGWTEVTKGGYEKENLARDVFALMDALGLERVKLIGHDWGGYAGFIMCVQAPERIERFVVGNVGHLWPQPSARSALDSWRFCYQLPLVLPFIGPRATRIPGLVKKFMSGREQGVFTDAELEAFEAPLRDPARSPSTAGYYRSFINHDLPLLMRGHWNSYRLTVPTLMLYGVDDFVVRPSMLAGYEPFADDMRIENVPDTAHFIVDAQPALVAERALDFFEAR